MKTEITQIKIKLEGRDIDLTATEARQLRDELNTLFGKPEKQAVQEGFDELARKLSKEIRDSVPHNTPAPTYPYLPKPIMIEPGKIPWHRPYETWCATEPITCRQGGEATISLRS